MQRELFPEYFQNIYVETFCPSNPFTYSFSLARYKCLSICHSIYLLNTFYLSIYLSIIFICYFSHGVVQISQSVNLSTYWTPFICPSIYLSPLFAIFTRSGTNIYRSVNLSIYWTPFTCLSMYLSPLFAIFHTERYKYLWICQSIYLLNTFYLSIYLSITFVIFHTELQIFIHLLIYLSTHLFLPVYLPAYLSISPLLLFPYSGTYVCLNLFIY